MTDDVKARNWCREATPNIEAAERASGSVQRPCSTAAYNKTLWSEIPPNSAGWWWLLWHGQLHVVRIKHEDDNQFYYVRSDIIPAFTDHWTNVRNIDGLWAGPIPLPSEPYAELSDSRPL